MDSGEMECRTALRRLFVYLDGEANDAERTAIDAHLVECAQCAAQFGSERELKLLIARKCSEAPLPANAVDALRARLDRVPAMVDPRATSTERPAS